MAWRETSHAIFGFNIADGILRLAVFRPTVDRERSHHKQRIRTGGQEIGKTESAGDGIGNKDGAGKPWRLARQASAK